MSTVCTRSGLIENDDMPSSYFPPWMPGMMPGKALFWNSAVSPSFCATAVPRSTSMPMIVVPSGAVNSFGGYEASVPNTILPSAATLCGTFAASASSFVGAGSALDAAAPADVGRGGRPAAVAARPAPGEDGGQRGTGECGGEWAGERHGCNLQMDHGYGGDAPTSGGVRPTAVQGLLRSPCRDVRRDAP